MSTSIVDKGDDVTVDDVEPIFLEKDILKGVSMIIGTVIFLGFCTFILYLKCRNRVNYRPYLTTQTGEPDNRSLMVHYSRARDIPQLTQSTLTELDHVSLHQDVQSPEHPPTGPVPVNTTYIITRDDRQATVVPNTQTNSLLGGYSQL